MENRFFRTNNLAEHCEFHGFYDDESSVANGGGTMMMNNTTSPLLRLCDIKRALYSTSPFLLLVLSFY